MAAFSGLVAGPLVTEPSAIENFAPWHLQWMSVPWMSLTGQPWWVHILLKALNSPSVGWVTTKLASSRITPPPTGMRLAGIERVLPAGGAPGEVRVGAEQPARAPVPTASAARPAWDSNVRRSGVMPEPYRACVGAAA